MLRRIHHVCLRTGDVSTAAQRWSIQFGLTIRELTPERARLACAYEPYSLELVESDAAGAEHTGYELARGVTLEDAARRLDGLGVAYSPVVGALCLRDPDGHGVELVPYDPDPDPRPAIARSSATLGGFHPRKLGHVNSLTGQLSAMVEFYCDVLGLRLTDRLGDEGCWLHLGADHHTVALVGKGYYHFHHLAFELTDWGELRVALDHLAQHGRWLAWGPVRHALGQNLAAYVRIPEEECMVELYSDMEQLSADHEPREWPDNAHSSNTWGILPPRSYFRFDPAAVEWERQGLEALGHGLPPVEDTARQEVTDMAMSVTTEATGARTGEQFLDGLRQGGREIWLRGERISHPLDHPELREAALSLARVFDLQHEHAASMLAPSPSPSPSGDPGRLVNVTHLIPREYDDLVRRRRAFELVAALSGGVMGRTPDYLNVTFACFAGRSEVWARRGNDALASNLVAYQEYMRDADLSTTHALMNPQVDRTKPEAEQAMGQVALHKVGETSGSIVVRGARMLATLAPFADELLVYPGSDIRPQDGRYALSFAIPIATPGLRFICRDSYSKQREVYDYPLSARFDEMDAVVIFDDVEIPRERVFLDGDTLGYSEVITDTGWRSHIMHQAFTRAWVKLSFALGLGHLIAQTTGVARFDHIQEKLGQIWSMSELARSAIVAAETGAVLDRGRVMTPDERPFVALRGEMPKWLPRVNELLQLIGGGGFMATPSRADLDGPLHDAIEQYFQAAGAGAERRIRLFRLAWDFLGSELGGRGELYERFYLSDSWRMTALAYNIADKSFPESLVEQFLHD